MIRRIFRYIEAGIIYKRSDDQPILILAVQYQPNKIYFVTDCATDKNNLIQMKAFSIKITNSTFVYNFSRQIGPAIDSYITLYNPKRRRNGNIRYRYGKLDGIPFVDSVRGDFLKHQIRRAFDLTVKVPAVI